MYVYLLHSFVLYPFRESGLLRDLEPTWLWLPIVVVASVLIALGLATKPVRRVFRPLIEPRPAWLFADPSLARREGRRNDPHRLAPAARERARTPHAGAAASRSSPRRVIQGFGAGGAGTTRRRSASNARSGSSRRAVSRMCADGAMR